MHSTGEGLCQNCLRSSTDRTTVPGEHKFQPALPYTMNAEREKCNTSLSQAIPVPNSSLYIICWFIINRLPLQFWSRYFLWINAGPCYFFFPPCKSIACKPSRVNPEKRGPLQTSARRRYVLLLEWCVGRRGYLGVTPGNAARGLVIICLSQTRLCWEASQNSLHKWLAAVC